MKINEEDADLSFEFLNPDILKFAKHVDKKDPRQAKQLREMYRRREQVNYKALQIIENKGAELCASMIAVMAEDHEEIASIAEMGWAVDQFRGIALAFNRMAEMSINLRPSHELYEHYFERAVMYRVFAIATLRWGAPHVESSTFDEFIREVYNAEINIPDEDLWDQAHARLQLENAELDVMWNEDEVVDRYIRENEEEDDDELD
jgi:hypothetical protein